MAKAALNMMTRTSATDYHADGIHHEQRGTGWVTDEDPVPVAARKVQEHRFSSAAGHRGRRGAHRGPSSRASTPANTSGENSEGLPRDGLVKVKLLKAEALRDKSSRIGGCGVCPDVSVLVNCSVAFVRQLLEPVVKASTD